MCAWTHCQLRLFQVVRWVWIVIKKIYKVNILNSRSRYVVFIHSKIKKTYLHHTGVATPKHVTSGGVRLAPGLLNSEETLQRWRAIGNTLSNLTRSIIELQTSRTDEEVFNHYASMPFVFIYLKFNLTVWLISE